jgi:hypothetical protein
MTEGAYFDAEVVQAYLFRCEDNGLYAVSLDPSGSNLPRNACAEGWHLERAFPLGVQDPVPAAIPPEPILRGLRNTGYYVWREGTPYGTTQ